ncbi:MlaD family protein [Nocardia sp. NPDC055321]
MTRGTWASLLGIATVFVFGSAYLTVSIAQIDPFEQRATVTMLLERSGSLAEGSPVLLRGIDVGEVERIDYTGRRVKVALRLRGHPQIPVTSAVRIETLSALGEPYIEFSPESATGPFLRDGQELDTRQVSEPLSLSQAARSLTHLLSELDPAVIASLTGALDRALDGTDSVTPTLSRATELLSATLIARMPQLEQLMKDLQDMGGDMEWFEPSAVSAAPLWTLFAQRFSEIVDSLAGISNVGDTPAMYLEGDGLVPVLERTTAWLDEHGPELARLAPVLAPLAGTPSSASIDLGALISQALAAVGTDDTVHLRITLK